MPKVLVVDDDSTNRELLVELLAGTGAETATASDGRQCLELFESFQPDLVLLDVEMPRMDGFAACTALKTNPATRLVPIILITGRSAVEDRVKGIRAGADDFLTKPVDRSELMARTNSLLSLKSFTDELERAEAVLCALAKSIEGKDPYTEGHCERLSEYGVRLGKHIGMCESDIVALHRAGIVHDIGKVAVPDSVLLKPGRLTDTERLLILEHPIVGEKICKPLKSFARVLPIIRHHHEKLNGTGYPDGLKGKAIPLTARVLQIVDVFDALTTVRPYKAALSQAEALGIMNEEVEKGWWDPELLREFEHLLYVQQAVFTQGACA
jgi:putative two-component system response regulator